MTNIKLSLNILLPGSTMFSEEESSKQLTKPVKNKSGKVVRKKGKVLTKTYTVPDFDKHDSFTLRLEQKGKAPKQIRVFTRKSRPARQVINMSEEAYQHMISKEQPAEFKGTWNALTIYQKLLWHCNRIAASLGGKVENFQVLD